MQNRQGGGLSQPYVLVKGGSKEGDREQRESRCRKEMIGLDYGTEAGKLIKPFSEAVVRLSHVCIQRMSSGQLCGVSKFQQVISLLGSHTHALFSGSACTVRLSPAPLPAWVVFLVSWLLE